MKRFVLFLCLFITSCSNHTLSFINQTEDEIPITFSDPANCSSSRDNHIIIFPKETRMFDVSHSWSYPCFKATTIFEVYIGNGVSTSIQFIKYFVNIDPECVKIDTYCYKKRDHGSYNVDIHYINDYNDIIIYINK